MLVHDHTSSGRINRPRPGLRWGRLVLVLFLMGFSFVLGIVLHREGYVREWRRLAMTTTHFNYYRALATAPALPTLHIDMKFKHYAQVERQRNEAVAAGILFASNKDLVPATIQFEGRTIPVKMRLKGDWVDHLRENKWSFRVQVKGDDALFGMRRFSLQHPRTRSYINEYAFLRHVRSEGILAPRYRFVNVVFNGADRGIYALEEHFAKELLEFQSRREGVIIKFDESMLWRKWHRMERPGRSNVEPDDYHTAPIDAFGSARIDQYPGLARQRDAAIDLLRAFVAGERSAADVFDLPLTARLLALFELWSARHGLGWHNLRFYYNPVTARLEPVAFDSEPPDTPCKTLLALETDFSRTLLEDPDVAEAYVREVVRLSQPGTLVELQNELSEPVARFLRALHREWPELHDPWEALRERQEYLRRVFDVEQPVLAYVTNDGGHSDAHTEPTVTLEVANAMSLPVEILGFRIDGGPLVDVGATLDGMTDPIDFKEDDGAFVRLPARRDQGPLQFRTFRVKAPSKTEPVQPPAAPTVTVAARMVGMANVVSVRAAFGVPATMGSAQRPDAEALSEVLSKHPFLTMADGEKTLRIKPGDWTVEGDVVAPDGFVLEAGPGTTLRFAPGAVFLTSGPVRFVGTAEAPVVLTSASESWAGLAVLDAGRASTWVHVEVNDTTGIDRSGWFLTGGITFYRSPISLHNCRITHSTAEDGINIIRSGFEFRGSSFGTCASDAFDGDFVTGLIQDCSFEDVGGDAIDVSGSDVRVENVTIRNVVDKGLSVGEQSQVDASGVVAERVGIAVASKDRSRVELRKSRIQRAHIGLAAYIKKAVYGPAELTAHDVILSDTDMRTLADSSCLLSLDDEFVPTAPVDLDKLYNRGHNK